jgi:peptidoglycan DL-endopeptidase CwlO
VHTPPSVREPWLRRTGGYRAAGVIISLITAAGLLLGTSGSAGAAPQPTIAQVQQRLSALDNRASRLGEQFDQAQQQLSTANQQLRLVNRQLARNQAKFSAMRSQIAKIAVAAYEDGSLNSAEALLTSDNPQQILDQSSILTELSSANSTEITQFLAAARQLTRTQQNSRRARSAIVALRSGLDKRRKSLDSMIAQQKALLAQLTPKQQVSVGGSGPPSGGTHYTGPTATQGEKAVAYAYAQLGCPYVWGGIGPCSAGFDCSGLVMAAWAAAGVSVPRTSYDDWAQLPHVSLSNLQPGDILVFNGASHVALYVGGNSLIQAPQTGQNVSKEPLSGWFTGSLDGAVRP